MIKGRTVLVLASALLAGCGDKPAETSSAPPPPAQMNKVADPVAETAPPPAPEGAPAAPAAVVEEAPANTDANQAALIAINRALEQYRDPSSRPNAGDLTESATKQYPQLKDVNDLVRAGFLKSIPPAPPGKKYVVDPSGSQVTLANQ